MTSTQKGPDPPSEPPKKRGRPEKRLVIPEEDAEEALDRLLGKKPGPRDEDDEEPQIAHDEEE